MRSLLAFSILAFATPAFAQDKKPILIGVEYAYPGGAKHNVETSFVDPTNGDVYLVTKEVPPLVFRIPAASLVAGATIALSAQIANLDALDHSTEDARSASTEDCDAG